MDVDTQEIVEAIESEDAREMLALASHEPMSADDLESELDVSLATVYRHAEELVELEFMEEATEITSSGNNYSTYETSVREIEFEIADGEFRLGLQYRDDVIDRFGRLWRSLGGDAT